MSELTLNLVDSQTILSGRIHGSVADSAIAALSAEPETISELEAALARFIKPADDINPFFDFHRTTTIDPEPWDAGLVIIDLPARVVFAESTYSQPGLRGEVNYHDGQQATDILIPYQLPDDWRFVYSLDDYRGLRTRRAMKRAANPPYDVREILYGSPLLNFIASAAAELRSAPAAQEFWTAWNFEADDATETMQERDQRWEIMRKQVADIHARWLLTQRDDLRGACPRDILFAHQDFLSFDLYTREMQWSLLCEGPPCLSKDSFAYRYAGIGPHEWVVYYDLVRELIHTSLVETDSVLAKLQVRAATWLEEPQSDYGGSVPAIIIENERKRLPMAIHPREMVVDEDCPMCQMIAAEGEMSGSPGFWHLDGAHMDDEFVFSSFGTREEWEANQREMEAAGEEYARREHLRRLEETDIDRLLDPYSIASDDDLMHQPH